MSYIHPLPSWQILQTFYLPEYGSYQTGGFRLNARSLKAMIAKWRYAHFDPRASHVGLKLIVASMIELATGRIVSFTKGMPLQLGTDAAIMDVGYGNGSMLLFLADMGYRHLYGYDIEANINIITNLEANGIQVFNGGEFDKLPISEGTLDCIILNHVFEHVIDPVSTLDICFRFLKPEGWLVLEIPCDSRATLCGFLPDLSYSALELPRHLCMHTRLSIQKLLSNAGFSRIEIRQYPVALQFISTWNNQGHNHGKKLPPFWGHIIQPIYRIAGTVLQKAEFITALGVK